MLAGSLTTSSGPPGQQALGVAVSAQAYQVAGQAATNAGVSPAARIERAARERQSDASPAGDETAWQAASVRRAQADEVVIERQTQTLRATLEYLRSVIQPEPLDGYTDAERDAKRAAEAARGERPAALDIEA